MHLASFVTAVKMTDKCWCAISGTVCVDRVASGMLHATDAYTGAMTVHLTDNVVILNSTITDETGNYYFGYHLMPGVNCSLFAQNRETNACETVSGALTHRCEHKKTQNLSGAWYYSTD